MTDIIKIIECPRDAWQALPTHIPAAVKASYLRLLIASGFQHIDAVSFVSPTAVPQMADSEGVLQTLAVPPITEIIGIVVNRHGVERAIATRKVNTLGFPFSVSPTFLQRNQKQSPEQSHGMLREIASLAAQAHLQVVAYVSMAFGNPYDDPWSITQVIDACSFLIAAGVQQISLADTVGLASPTQVAELFAQIHAAHPNVELGLHLHARPDHAESKIRAAYSAGCRRFDSALGGLGGCPFAQDALVGNIPTEILISTLKSLGADLPPLHITDRLLTANEKMTQSHTR